MTELTVWSMWSGQEEQNFVRVLQRYEQLHPNIKIHNLGAVGDDTKTIRALVAGVAPDFFTIADTATLGVLANNQALRPLDAEFTASKLNANDFVPAALAMCRYRNHLYGMPFLIDDRALLWNKAAFKEAGLDPDRAPRTLEELADDAVKLTRRDASGKLTRLGLRQASDIYLFFTLFGGRLMDESNRRVTADNPANLAAITWYKGLIDRMGGIEAVNAFESGFGRNQGASNPFFVGKVAMIMDGEWNPYWISRYAPQMGYGVAPVPPPAAHPERARSTWLGGNVFCIPKESKHPQEAWDFFVWMQSEAAQVMFAHDMNNVPNTRAALHSPALREGAPFRKQYAIFCDLADSPNADFFPTLPVASFYMSRLSNATDKVLFGEQTPAQAYGEATKRIQTELDQQ